MLKLQEGKQWGVATLPDWPSYAQSPPPGENEEHEQPFENHPLLQCEEVDAFQQ